MDNTMKIPKSIQDRLHEYRKVAKEFEALYLKVYKEPIEIEGYSDAIILSCAMDEYIKKQIERTNKLREIQ